MSFFKKLGKKLSPKSVLKTVKKVEKKVVKYANPATVVKGAKKVTEDKHFRASFRKVTGRLDQIGAYGIMAAGTLWGGAAGAAAGTALAQPMLHHAGRTLARSRGHGGMTARKVGRKQAKYGLITGGILTGGALVGAAAGVGGLTSGVLSGGAASAAGAGAAGGAAAASTAAVAAPAAAAGGVSAGGVLAGIGTALSVAGTVAGKILGGGGAGGGPQQVNVEGGAGAGGAGDSGPLGSLFGGTGLDPATEEGKSHLMLLAAAVVAAVFLLR